MGVRYQIVLKTIGSYVPLVLVLAGLLGIGYWGAENDWKIPSFAKTRGAEKDDDDDDKTASDSAVKTDGKGPGSWCEKHDILLSQCTVCNPQIANKGKLSKTEKAAAGDDKPGPDPRTCQTHLSRIVFPNDQALRKTGLRLAEVKEQLLVRSISAPATVDYDQTRLARISSRLPGTLWRVYKRVGQVVKQGEVVAIVESTEVGKSKAEFLRAAAQVALKTKVWEDVKKVPNAVSQRTVKEAENALREARIRLFNAQQSLINLGLSAAIDDVVVATEQQLADRLRFLGIPTSLARAFNPLTTTANLLPVKAPFDGVILTRDMVRGETVEMSKPLFVVADVSHMSIFLAIRQEDAADLEIGQEVLFQPDGDATLKAQGTVAWVSTEADKKTRTLRVRADVRNLRHRLRANIFGTGTIVLGRNPRALVVPSEAIQWEGCCQVVFVRVGPRTFQPRKVRLGMRLEKVTEIRVGLLPGEIVVTTGSHVLKSELFKSKIAAEE